MEKLRIGNMEELEKKLESSLNESYKDEEFKNLVSKLKISKEETMKNVTKINDTIEELKVCKKCKGLYSCGNKVKGYVYFPEKRNDRLNFIYTPCKYKKKFLKEEEEKNIEENILDHCRMKDVKVDDKNQLKVIKWIKNYYDEYSPNKKMKGVFLHGSFGSGKTYLLSCLLNELSDKKDALTEIVYFPELLRDFKNDFSLVDRKMEYLKRVDILLIDDLGAETVTEWGRDEILGTILQYRMNSLKSTFITSNLNINELQNHLSSTKNMEDEVKSKRIIERVKSLTEDIELISSNHRI